MSEFRQDPTTDSWVIIAPDRNRRPRAGQEAAKRTTGALRLDPACPFCPGNEVQLPGIIAEIGSRRKPGWRTRVVLNKFPAVDENSTPSGAGSAFYETAACHGHHDVVIETPRHDLDLATMSEDEVRDVLVTYRSRYAVLIAERAVRSVIVFRNRGSVAGASLSHPHSQVIALEVVPPHVQRRQAAMLSYYQREGRCALCDLIAFERRDRSRIIAENDRFVTLVPFAAISLCELSLLPKRHQADFGAISDSEIELLASALRDALLRLNAALDHPPYNYMIDTATTGELRAPHLHWRLRIVPQLAVPGGFELASGLPINPSLPEGDAAVLRSFRRRTIEI